MTLCQWVVVLALSVDRCWINPSFCGADTMDGTSLVQFVALLEFFDSSKTSKFFFALCWHHVDTHLRLIIAPSPSGMRATSASLLQNAFSPIVSFHVGEVTLMLIPELISCLVIPAVIS